MKSFFCPGLEQEGHWFLSFSSAPQKWCAAIKQESARQTWQSHLRNGIGERPAGLALMDAGVLYIAFCTDARESSSEITSCPVNTFSVGFSDSIWRTRPRLSLCADITPPILRPVKIRWTWHIDTVSEAHSRSPASSKYYGCLRSGHAAVKRTWFLEKFIFMGNLYRPSPYLQWLQIA